MARTLYPINPDLDAPTCFGAEWMGPHCDVLVRGEIEPVADELLAALASGRYAEEYEGEAAGAPGVEPPAAAGRTAA